LKEDRKQRAAGAASSAENRVARGHVDEQPQSLGIEVTEGSSE
jgi:hypothetical protein